MPFVSKAQRAFMYANHPAMAAEFQAATPAGKKLPEHVRRVHKTMRKLRKKGD